MNLFPPSEPPPRQRWWGVGLGAGLLGALLLGLRGIIRPPTKAAIPENISPPGFSTRAFQSGRGQMIYHESGEAGPEAALVFIHGLEVGASSYEWAAVYAAFAGTRRVLAPDLIGFGESERPDAKFSAAEVATSLAEFIDGLCHEETQRPIVVASGLGGGLATLMAGQNPELLSRLILWMPTGRANPSLAMNLGARVPTLKRFLYRNHLARRSSIRRRFAARAGIRPQAAPAEAMEVYALCAQQYQADCAIYRLLQRRLDLELVPALRQTKAPVTLLWPGQAAPAALEHARRIAAEAPLGSLRIVPATNACAPILAPGALVTALGEELRLPGVAV